MNLRPFRFWLYRLMGDKNQNTLSLDEYRERRIKDGSWPPSSKDQKEYWRGRMNDLLDRRSLANANAKKVGKAPAPIKETLPPLDPLTGKPNFTKEELAEFDKLFPDNET